MGFCEISDSLADSFNFAEVAICLGGPLQRQSALFSAFLTLDFYKRNNVSCCFIPFPLVARVRLLEWNVYTVNMHWPQQRRMVYFGIVETNRAVNSSAHRKIVTSSQKR